MLSLVGIAPHPPIILPEIGRGELKKAQKTVDGMKELAGRIKRKAPELLIIITPHGEVSHRAPVVLTAEQLRGDFARFGFPKLQFSFKTDRKLLELTQEEFSSEELQPLFIDDAGIALDHGAMVPLYYLAEAGVKAAGLHLTFSFNSYRELYNFGRTLRRAVNRRGLSTAVIASGDLSHRLISGAPAGYSPRGEEFDLLLVDLIRHGRIEDILNIDQNLVEEAGECGLRSFIIALGMLAGEAFASEIISYEGPFGVGYLVAALERQEQR